MYWFCAGTLSPFAEDGTFVGWSPAEMVAASKTAEAAKLCDPTLYGMLLTSLTAALGVDHADVLDPTKVLNGAAAPLSLQARETEAMKMLKSVEHNTLVSSGWWSRGQAMVLDMRQVWCWYAQTCMHLFHFCGILAASNTPLSFH
jgi:hypothetical protein